MVETLFGSGPQVWPTLPITAAQAAYYQGPRGIGGGIPSAQTTLTPQFATGPTGGAQSETQRYVGYTWQPEANGGITAQALLALVISRRGQTMGPVTDPEIEDIISDALDMLAGAAEIEVRCEEGRITLTGNVPHKRVKRDAGEIAWAIPSINDVQNNIAIAARRRSRTPRREAEAAQGRKSA